MRKTSGIVVLSVAIPLVLTLASAPTFARGGGASHSSSGMGSTVGLANPSRSLARALGRSWRESDAGSGARHVGFAGSRHRASRERREDARRGTRSRQRRQDRCREPKARSHGRQHLQGMLTQTDCQAHKAAMPEIRGLSLCVAFGSLSRDVASLFIHGPLNTATDELIK